MLVFWYVFCKFMLYSKLFMIKLLNKQLHFFLPKGIKEDPIKVFQYHTLLRLILLCVSISAILLSCTYYIYGIKFHDLIIFVICFALLLSLQFIHSLHRLGLLLCIFLTLGAIYKMPYAGGVFGESLHWLVLLPLFALILGGKRQAQLWLAACCIYLAYLSYDSHTNMEAMLVALRGTNPIYTFLSCMLVLVIIYTLVDMQQATQQMVIEELNKKNRELEEQTVILKAKEELLSNTNRELETFAYAASHDMKEPLRMIGMYTQLLNKRMAAVEIKDKDEFVGYVTDGVQRMESMLDDLLSYSRIGKSADYKMLCINDLVDIVERNLAVKIRETNTIIEKNALPTMEIPLTEFTQLLQNIIANGIKFAKADIAPHIKITYSETPKMHRFEIMDNGIGIPAKFHDRVFNIFERLHSHADIKGSGIGLATCKKVVEKMNGKIWIESIERVGTTIIFEIPK